MEAVNASGGETFPVVKTATLLIESGISRSPKLLSLEPGGVSPLTSVRSGLVHFFLNQIEVM